jgi:cyclophilin family peptidyl-prolyl cis-trans isomerase/HEAT repeat protein
MTWILRLEDQRVLRDPDMPAADLTRMLTDSQARVRRRAALAVGRVGLTGGVPPLVTLLSDNDPEVRQMAAFALGLIGDRQTRDPLVMALTDPSPLMQGSAAEALGLVGDPAAADAIGRLVAGVVQSGALASPPADADEARRDTPAAAFRLGVFALVRLKAYDQLSAAVLDPSGKPRVTWWPVAFALQRLEDKRALPALLALAGDSNAYTRAFAVKGLGALKDRSATPVILPLLASRDTGVVIEAIRALGKIGDPAAAGPLLQIVRGRGPQQQRVEAVTALGGLRGTEIADSLVDAIGDRDPQIRSAALRSASSVDPEGFVTILSGLDPDPDWRARAALASLLGELPRQTALPRLTRMLDDSDQRVIAAVLTSLVKIGAPNAGDILLDHLKADDPVVRAAAASGIGELRLPAGAQALPAAYQFGLRDATYVARAAAIEAFAKYGISVSRSLLDAALADKDWAVRVRAAVLLRQGEPATNVEDRIRPAPTRMTAEGYQSVNLTSPTVSTQAFIDTDRGTIQIELAVLDAPLTVDNFIALARRGFFNGLMFHRVVPNFVVQGGDPRGDGEGGPGYTLRNEISEQPYLRGTVGIALDWADTGGSQFFITHSPQPHLDGKYTVFGRVIAGMDVVDGIQQGDIIRRVRVWDGQQQLEAAPN